MVDLDLDDVLVFGHRPIGTVLAVGGVMHWIFTAQAFEEAVMRILMIDAGIADIKLVKRDGVGIG